MHCVLKITTVCSPYNNDVTYFITYCFSLSHVLHKAAISKFLHFSVRNFYIQFHKQRYLITNYNKTISLLRQGHDKSV
jgi:hypothetical protein